MGKTLINGKAVVAPTAQMKVSELKELANIPPHEVLYDKNGTVLDNNQTVPTEEAQYGSVTDWERGFSY